MGYFKPLHRKLITYMDKQQIDAVYRSYLLAKKAHKGQKRQNGEPYITHPVAVAEILATMRMDLPTVMAAVMHDLIEDTEVGKEKISQEFGKEIADLVDGVSKLTQIEFESHARAEAENLRKMILATAKDTRVILVKLADRLHNMRTLKALSQTKQERIAQQTLSIYAPIAHRLGMQLLRLELEELAFAALFPYRHAVLRTAVYKMRGNRKEVIATIEQALHQSLSVCGITHYEIKSREKNLYSIYKKMRDRQLSFSEIMDIYGFRIIVDNVDTCYRALGAVHNLYKPIAQRFKDYIAIPKSNGYQSLHTTVFGSFGMPIEIQIRTFLMEKIAENGIAAHWIYKSGQSNFADAHRHANEWIKGVIEIQNSAGTSLEFIENVKQDLFPDETYVFTPRGKIIKLPANATGVDFAYAVHSDLGNNCIAIKVDRRLVPLSTPLVSGQTVEVITSPEVRPSLSWLNFVVTGKARGQIRHFLKNQKQEEAITLGQRLLEKALASLGFSYDNALIMQLVNFYQLATIDELLIDIGFGNRAAVIVANQLANIKNSREHKSPAQIKPLAIRGTEGMVVNFAACCRPIPGDAIMGQLVKAQGIMVHLEECGNLLKVYNDPYQCIPLEWHEQVTGDFCVDLHIEIENRRGILAALALIVAQAESNIDNIVAEEKTNEFFFIKLTISVKNTDHLTDVMRCIKNLHGIAKIMRYKQVNKHGL